jgi:hypothetical protein
MRSEQAECLLAFRLHSALSIAPSWFYASEPQRDEMRMVDIFWSFCNPNITREHFLHPKLLAVDTTLLKEKATSSSHLPRKSRSKSQSAT